MGSKNASTMAGGRRAAQTDPEKSADPTQGLWFSFEIGSDEFIAFISSDALEIHFNAGLGERQLRAAYRKYRPLIDAVARRKFLVGGIRPIRLNIDDFSVM